MKEAEKPCIKLKVTEALTKDVGRALARMGPEDLEKLKVTTGDTVEVEGKRKALCKVMPAFKEIRGQSRVQLDGLTRENAGVGLDDDIVAGSHIFAYRARREADPVFVDFDLLRHSDPHCWTLPVQNLPSILGKIRVCYLAILLL